MNGLGAFMLGPQAIPLARNAITYNATELAPRCPPRPSSYDYNARKATFETEEDENKRIKYMKSGAAIGLIP